GRFTRMPAVSPERIGTLGTLRDIVALLAESEVDEAKPARPPAVLATIADDSTARILLVAVAEKTGHPREMLELDMRLDDDLGIDSIKRVEILSAVQDRLPDTRSIGPDQTGTLRTLRDIVAFLSSQEGSAPRSAEPVRNGHIDAPRIVEVK